MNNKRTKRMYFKRVRAVVLLILLISLLSIPINLLKNKSAFAVKSVVDLVPMTQALAESIKRDESEGNKTEVVDLQYEEDVKWLAMIGHTEIGLSYNKSTNSWYESTDESILWVMASIYNRSKSSLYPDTIKGVVTQGKGTQFNGYRSKDFGTVTPRMEQLAKMILNEEFTIDSDIMWYFNPDKSTNKKFVNEMMKYKVYDIGGHIFCNNDGRGKLIANK